MDSYICLSVGTKGATASMLKIGSKRRRRKNDGLQLDPDEEFQQRMEREVATRTKSLREQLQAKEQEAMNNSNASIILTGMLRTGDLEMDGHGNVRVNPNVIGNEGSFSQ